MEKKEEEIFVTKSSIPPLDTYVELIRSIWDTRILTNNGPLCQAFRSELIRYLKCDYLELFTNGHMALDIAIKALELKGEIITTPFSFASTTHAITMNGIRPVFCDIKRDDLTIDEEMIESLITEKTSAIIPVHVYGLPCNIEKISQIAEKYHLKVIYDAAHAFGETIRGKSFANFGDISMFSFHATKAFNSIEGGALTFSDISLQKKVQMYRNFGIENAESVVSVGFNAKMNEFCAAMGLSNMPEIEKNIALRKGIAEIYYEFLHDVPGIRNILFEKCNNDIELSYTYYPIVIDEKVTGYTRNQIFDELEKHGIHARKYFYPLIPDFECYKGKYINSTFPIARYVAERVMTLPLYADLSIEIVKKISNIIKSYSK